MKKIIIPIVVSALFGTVSADEKAFYDENGHTYERIDSSKSWRDAKEFCEDEGGHLATITDRNERDFIHDELARNSSSSMWLGGTDEDREDDWRWVTGERWSYESWASGKPNDRFEGQDYLSFNSNGSHNWDDNGLPHNNDRKKFICEYEDDNGGGDCEAKYTNGRLTIIIDMCS